MDRTLFSSIAVALQWAYHSLPTKKLSDSHLPLADCRAVDYYCYFLCVYKSIAYVLILISLFVLFKFPSKTVSTFLTYSDGSISLVIGYSTPTPYLHKSELKTNTYYSKRDEHK